MTGYYLNRSVLVHGGSGTLCWCFLLRPRTRPLSESESEGSMSGEFLETPLVPAVSAFRVRSFLK